MTYKSIKTIMVYKSHDLSKFPRVVTLGKNKGQNTKEPVRDIWPLAKVKAIF